MKGNFGRIVVAFAAGLIIGALAMLLWQQKLEAGEKELEAFLYGVVSSSLQGTDVEWKEYPQFRTVEFGLQGELVAELPAGGEIVPDGLVDEAALQEISREHKRLSDGATVLEYDVVTYLFEQARIKANVSNLYDAELDAMQGYQLSCTIGEESLVVGYILPMCPEFHVCTKEETTYWNHPQSLDFGLLKLSQTYSDGDVTQCGEHASGIVVERTGDSYDITLRNEGDVQWGYSTMVPSLEVWNRGVWMELETFLSDPCMGAYLQAGEEKAYPWTESMLQSLPYQAPGIYRIVVHGAFEDKGTYATTESFVIE